MENDHNNPLGHADHGRDAENRLKDDFNKTAEGLRPEDDPALINPDELATFPKEQSSEDVDIESERQSHLVNRKDSPVRDGRNITRTGPGPDDDGGFM